MSQPLHQRRPGLALNLPHSGNPAERLAQADRVIARETKQHALGTERPQTLVSRSTKGTAEPTLAKVVPSD